MKVGNRAVGIVSLGFLWPGWCSLMLKAHNKERTWQLALPHTRGLTPAVNGGEGRLLCAWSFWDHWGRAQGGAVIWHALLSHNNHWDRWWAPRVALVYLIIRFCTERTSICLDYVVVLNDKVAITGIGHTIQLWLTCKIRKYPGCSGTSALPTIKY